MAHWYINASSIGPKSQATHSRPSLHALYPVRRPIRSKIHIEMASAIVSRSALLELPGEIRNRIYRFVLVCDNRIEVHAGAPLEPALLSVCREVRTEAIKLFYVENKFTLVISNFNKAVPCAWRAVRKRFPSMPRTATFRLKPTNTTRSWPNLLDWLRAIHAGDAAWPEDPTTQFASRNGLECLVTFTTLAIATKCRSRTWQETAEILEMQHVVLRQINSGWA